MLHVQELGHITLIKRLYTQILTVPWITEGLRISACYENETAGWAMHQPQGSQRLDVSALNFGKVSKGTCHLMSQRNLSSAKQVTKQQIAKQTSGVQGG